MGKIFDMIELIDKSHTIKTVDNQIWINIGNGKFLKRQSIFSNQTKLCNARNLYNHTKSVMAKGEVIAYKHTKTGKLIRVADAKKIKDII